MCLLAGQGSFIGASRCTSNFLHLRHSTVACITQNASAFAISAMDVDHIDTNSPDAVVSFQCFGGTVVPANILGPSERGADYRSVTYERCGTVVTHDCAPIAGLILWFICPGVCMSCFVSRVRCIVNHHSGYVPSGVRKLSCAGGHYTRGGGQTSRMFMCAITFFPMLLCCHLICSLLLHTTQCLRHNNWHSDKSWSISSRATSLSWRLPLPRTTGQSIHCAK